MSNLEDFILTIIKEASKEKDLGIELDSIRKIAQKGFNSEVYQAASSVGKIVIHILKPVPEQIRQKVDRKVDGVARLLDPIEEIPNASFLLTRTLPDGRYLFVQKKLPGSNLGQRKLEGDTIVDEFFVDNKAGVIRELNQILVRKHQIRFSKFGWLQAERGEVNGCYGSWADFIAAESQVWFRNILADAEAGYRLDRGDIERVKEKIEKLYQENRDLLKNDTAVLVHGDMINPGNVLIEGGSISGIIDYEWALAGDPAWEFAYSGNSEIEHYFDEAETMGVKYDRELFLRKMRFYKIPWLLWGTNVHARGNALKKVLFKELKEYIDEYDERD